MEWMSRLVSVAVGFSALAGRNKEMYQFRKRACDRCQMALSGNLFLSFLLVHYREEKRYDYPPQASRATQMEL